MSMGLYLDNKFSTTQLNSLPGSSEPSNIENKGFYHIIFGEASRLVW